MTDIAQFEPIIDLAVSNGLLTAEQVEEIREEHGRTGRSVRNLVVDMGFVEEDDLLQMMAAYQGAEVVDLAATDIPNRVIRTIPASVARIYNVLPVSEDAGEVTLAVASMIDPQVTDELMFVLTRNVKFVFAREKDLRDRINQFYGDEGDTVSDMLSSLEAEMERSEDGAEPSDDQALEEAAGAAPVVRFVNLVLYQAVKERASDIHFEPFERDFRIRYRVDGALLEMKPPPRRLALPLTSRIKVMAGLNIAERRVPQDGRIQVSVAGRLVDLRVSCLPTQFGESVVLRVLDRSVVSLDLENLGLPEDILDSLSADIEKPNGILIVTGPTGSGKTTSLYSCLKRINREGTKLLTAEEPVEYDIDGIVQVPVNPQTGNTFPRILRAFLRQDPDIIMIGEVRDLETAQIAIQASLTGHLVFSTLHTNDAAGAVTRLIDMNIEPFLLAATLESILGQRLVRTICANCKKPYTPDGEVLKMLGLSAEEIGQRPFYFGAGCEMCNETGYKGRKGIFEYLKVTEPIRELVNARKPTLTIRDKARELGMRTMREDGIRSVLDGYTTVDEVIRYT